MTYPIIKKLGKQTCVIFIRHLAEYSKLSLSLIYYVIITKIHFWEIEWRKDETWERVSMIKIDIRYN